MHNDSTTSINGVGKNKHTITREGLCYSKGGVIIAEAMSGMDFSNHYLKRKHSRGRSL